MKSANGTLGLASVVSSGALAALLATTLLSSFANAAGSLSPLPITEGVQPGSYKSIPEAQKGGTLHIGEGLSEEQERSSHRASLMTLSNQPASLPNKALQCKINVLKKLGWEVNQNLPANSRPQVQSNNACYARTMDQLKSSHALRISLPANLSRSADAQKANAAVDEALMGEGTVCAYKTFVQAAVDTATTRLFNNHLYSFANIFGSGSVRMGNLPQYWTQVSCFEDDKCWQPLSAPSYAFDALYRTAFATECATGLQVAEYAMIKETFGATEFDRRFRNQELYVGPWDSITKSASVTHGTTGRRYMSYDGGVSYVKSGPQMLVGVGGYIENVFGEDYLDVPVDRGENMLVVRESNAAAQALLKNGGLSYYNLVTRKIWEIGHGYDAQSLRQLSLGRKIMLSEDANTIQLRQMLTDPFLSETIVYVHDVGFRSIAQHLIRLIGLNPRTPYKLRFYAESIHGEVYDRWMQMQMDNCDQP